MTAHPNPAIERAMTSVAAAVPQAEADPARPRYHFRPPAQWMNDPNGVIFHNGWYHLFYQHNPYNDGWGHIHWGHARSRDLVHWEHLPIALWPSLELNEAHCFSGCAALDGQGRPLLIYTSVPNQEDGRPPFAQWAAVGDPDWIHWQKHPANPILALETHGGPPLEADWRDPFVFHEAGRAFLVLAGSYDDVAAVALYEAADASLTRWDYRGLLYQTPRSDARLLECPNFVRIGDKWILLTSPFRPVEYVTGRFDVGSLTFTPEQRGVLDPGATDAPNYYATNILFDAAGRCILLGWVRGFPAGRGWNGCLALPRILTIGDDGHPRQQPIPELQRLRGREQPLAPGVIRPGAPVMAHAPSDTFELEAVIEVGNAHAVTLRLGCAEDGGGGIAIRYDGQTLDVAGTVVAIPAGEELARLALQIFVDKSVLEVYVNGGRLCVTRVVEPPGAGVGVCLAADGGNAQLLASRLWEMRGIW